jgi:epoxide hydrolase 4
MANEIGEYFVSANGIRTHYLRGGSGPTLLLLHGWPEWSHIWRPVITRLAGDYDLVAGDFRGFGESDNPSPEPSLDAGPAVLADDVLALADALGVERFGIVAHDIGSFVAQTLVRQAPERVAGLFFFNCAYPGIGARWVEPRHLSETWYQFFHQLPWVAELIGSSRESCRIYLDNFLRHWAYQDHVFDDEIDLWVDNFMRPGNLQGGFNWYRSNHESRMAVIEGRAPTPGPIDCPTRVFWGAHDPLFKREWTDALGEYFSDLEFDFAPDAGHFVHYETPQRAADEIARFFSRQTF